MQECDIIELEDFYFNHTVHHYDDELIGLVEYSQEHQSISVHAEYCGEIFWDEH